MAGSETGGGSTGDNAARESASDIEATQRWNSGDYEGAIQLLVGGPSTSARDKRDQWTAWFGRIAEHFGPAGRSTMQARQQLAFWTSRCGLYADALGRYGELVPLIQSELGSDDSLTLRVLFDQALCLGVNGHPAETGESGHFRDAYELADQLLPRQRSVLQDYHRDTMRTRFNRARWLAAAGDRATALEQLRALLADQKAAVGSEHPDVARTARKIEELSASDA
jgi:hypothetical protein